MATFLPYQKFEVETRLSAVAVRQKLMEIVEPRKMRWGWSRNHLPFEGKVEVSISMFVTDERVGFWMIIPLAVAFLGAPTIVFHWELSKAKKILNEQLEVDKYSLS